MIFFKKSGLFTKSIDFLQKVLTFYKKSGLFTKSLDFLQKVISYEKTAKYGFSKSEDFFSKKSALFMECIDF